MPRDIGPGPSAYVLPPLIGYKNHDKSRWQNPAYQMGLYLKSHTGSVSPGPKYQTRDMTRYGHPAALTFKFNSRRKPFKDAGFPGPGAHSPELKEKKPGGAFGVKHMGKKPPVGPGPAAYNLRQRFPPGPNFVLTSKPRYKPIDYSPGPAAYGAANMEKVKRRIPTFKLTGRTGIPSVKTVGPGPNAYKYHNVPGPKAPSFAFGVKRVTDPYITPEDNACVVERE